MNSSDMKNMIVLKNLHSNLIEEAIVILKNNTHVKIPQIEGEVKEEKGKSKDYIVKEAEMHIAQYVSSIENHKKTSKNNKELEKKYLRLKRITKFLAVVAIMGIIVNILT